MKKYLFTLVVIMAMSLLVTACGGSSGAAATPAKPNTLTATKTGTASLDASAGFWTNTPKLEVATKAAKKGNSDGPTITLQAAYDANNIVFRAEWADTTESVLKSAWAWDGSAFTQSGNEDRLMVAWPIGNNAEFASKGCAVKS